MTDSTMSLGSKIKLGLILFLAALLLWFLVVNLFTNCEISLWPIAKLQELPGTLFMFLFLLIGFVAGFGSCFYWLRGKRLGKAIDMLTEEDEKKENGAAESEGAEPTA